eukprot:jgi/Ulvmu1/7620/UM038_0045.1
MRLGSRNPIDRTVLMAFVRKACLRITCHDHGWEATVGQPARLHGSCPSVCGAQDAQHLDSGTHSKAMPQASCQALTCVDAGRQLHLHETGNTSKAKMTPKYVTTKNMGALLRPGPYHPCLLVHALMYFLLASPVKPAKL